MAVRTRGGAGGRAAGGGMLPCAERELQCRHATESGCGVVKCVQGRGYVAKQSASTGTYQNRSAGRSPRQTSVGWCGKRGRTAKWPDGLVFGLRDVERKERLGFGRLSACWSNSRACLAVGRKGSLKRSKGWGVFFIRGCIDQICLKFSQGSFSLMEAFFCLCVRTVGLSGLVGRALQACDCETAGSWGVTAGTRRENTPGFGAVRVKNRPSAKCHYCFGLLLNRRTNIR